MATALGVIFGLFCIALAIGAVVFVGGLIVGVLGYIFAGLAMILFNPFMLCVYAFVAVVALIGVLFGVG